jgi:hypothetical protein
MSREFRCCHGTPETGHSPTCPYDKLFYGPEGVRIKGFNHRPGIDFHRQGLQHGPGSKYAQNLKKQADGVG